MIHETVIFMFRNSNNKSNYYYVFYRSTNSSKLLKQIKKNSKKSPHNYCLTSVTHARHDKTHSMHALSPLLFLGNDDLRAGLTARMFYSYKIRITIW